MNLLIKFILNLILIDMVWVCVEMLIDGHTTTRTVDLIMGSIWALTSVIDNKNTN